MSAAFGERDGQMAGRICLSEQNIGDGAAFLLSCIPLYKDGGYMLLFPCDGERLSRNQDQHDRFPGGMDGLYQLPLGTCQRKVGKVEALSAVGFVVIPCQRGASATAEQNSCIALPCRFNSRRNLRGIHGHHVASFGITYLYADRFHLLAYAFQRGDAILVGTAPSIISKLHLVCVRSDDSNGFQLR